MTRPFRVVTHKRWLAEQFAPMGAVQDFGFDIDPETATETIWWAPGAWVASALAAGVELPLLSCGADWLSNLPREYRGRAVGNYLLHDIFPGKTRAMFAKLPEAKLDWVPARVYAADSYLRRTLEGFGLPEDTVWQLQDPVEFFCEARFWIAHRQIVARSFYRIGDAIWGSDDFEKKVSLSYAAGWAFDMRHFAEEVAANVDAPPGYVLDVGVTTEEDVLVVEANAAWSSGPYDGDPAGVFAAIEASHDFEGRYPQWRYRPHAALHKAGPLKLASPVPK